MNSFVSVLLVAAVALAGVCALTEEQVKKADGFAAECLTKFEGLTKEAVGKLRAGEFENVDKNQKCFVKCFLERAGFMDAEGNLQEDYMIERLSLDREKSKVEALVKKCSEKKDDACETAFAAFECYYNGKASLF
ncbi:general odorant-binding protein 56d-like [Uranotaenia lowii]|uniref:general odorant-binding protein 56d-like n=1 Tax=Uranotaenia lowii TaxID=190385 RepID=UPI002479E3D9|nr:general odorant-binding protein 56d-like [Uranotaenia lowii]